jgi:hypothetical protein
MNSSDNENMQGGDSDMGKRQGLIAVNDLTYALEPDLSVAVNKTMKKHFFQSTEYKDNQRAICIVNSGADYIDTRRSHLTFGVRLPKSIASDAQLMKERVVRNRGGLGDGSENLLYKRDTAKPLTVAHPSKIDEIGATDDETANIQAFHMLRRMYGTYGSTGAGDAAYTWTESASARGPDKLGSYDAPLGKAGHYVKELIRSSPDTFSNDDFVDQAGNTVGYFGMHGSACNLIDSITVSTRSGDPLCHLRDFGLMQNMLLPLSYGKEWFDNHGGLMKYGDLLTAGHTHQVSIPMYLLSPLFSYGRLMPSMLMSGLRIEISFASAAKAFMGVRAPGPADHIATTGGASGTVAPTYQYTEKNKGLVLNEVESFTISDPVFHLCSVQLSDSIQRALNEQSAQNGLEIVYCDYESNPTTMGNVSTSFNVEIRKSCSRALKAFARVLVNGTGYYGQGLRDSFKSEDFFPFQKYQWRLGSLYFPQQEVAGTRDEVAVQAYANLLECVDKYHGGATPPALVFSGERGTTAGASIPMDIINGKLFGRDTCSLTAMQQGTEPRPADHIYRGRYGGTDVQLYQDRRSLREGETSCAYHDGMHGKWGSFFNDQTTIGVSLERSNLFNLAGIPINNSRVLSFQCGLEGAKKYEFHGATATASKHNERVCHVFLKFVKLARIWLNNVEVEQ